MTTNKKISQLPSASVLTDNDYFPLVDYETLITQAATTAQISTYSRSSITGKNLSVNSLTASNILSTTLNILGAFTLNSLTASSITTSALTVPLVSVNSLTASNVNTQTLTIPIINLNLNSVTASNVNTTTLTIPVINLNLNSLTASNVNTTTLTIPIINLNLNSITASNITTQTLTSNNNLLTIQGKIIVSNAVTASTFEATVGGFKFPDATVQTTAAGVQTNNFSTLTGSNFTGSNAIINFITASSGLKSSLYSSLSGTTIISGSLQITGSVLISGSMLLSGSIYGYNSVYKQLTGNYNIGTDDAGKTLLFNYGNQLTATVIVPGGMPIGYGVNFIQQGSGTIQLVPGPSVNIYNRQFATRSAGVYAIMSLLHVSGNLFVSTGDMTI